MVERDNSPRSAIATQLKGLAGCRRSAFVGMSFYGLSSLVVLAGVWFGVSFLERQVDPYAGPPGQLGAMGNRDGVSYALIAREGYSFDRQQLSSVAYFPAYPIAGMAVIRLTRASAESALLIVAHVCLIAAFVMLAAYGRERYRDSPAELGDWVVIAFALWPTTLFFRMTYSESVFVLVGIAAMYAMQKQWPAWRVAIVVGLATACRPVGVALLAPLGYYLWQTRSTRTDAALRAAVLAPVATWGLLAYMGYQHQKFGDPLAFVKAQDHFTGHVLSQREQIFSALTLEPIWSKYDPNSPAYWARGDDVGHALFSMEFANPIYFLVTLGLVVLGTWKGWLDEREWLLAIALLMIPYLTHAHRAGMLSQGRYAASVFPVYLVMGHLLYRMPPPLAAGLCGCSAFMLGAYSALFAASYRII